MIEDVKEIGNKQRIAIKRQREAVRMPNYLELFRTYQIKLDQKSAKASC